MTNTRLPKNGALLLAKNAAVDLTFLRTLAHEVQNAARLQDAAGEDLDDVEFSLFQGPYDWRTYLAEELALAKSRLFDLGGRHP